MRSILGTACTPKSEGGLGYRAVVVNFRGCAGVELTSAQFYSAGHTDDIRSALLYISSKYPRAPLLGVGFSLGAGVLTRYLGEEGAASRLKAGCVLACVSEDAPTSFCVLLILILIIAVEHHS